MKNIIFKTLIFSVFFALNGVSQEIKPFITARVDTSKVAVKEVYHLYKNYWNSRPDSLLPNPYWNHEKNVKAKSKKLEMDNSINWTFDTVEFGKAYFDVYKPTILQIDSIAKNRYQIKTLFQYNGSEKEFEIHKTIAITKLYAVRDSKGFFKLENVRDYDTRNWKRYKFDFITYIVHPDSKFRKEEAKRAIAFCKKISNMLGIKIIPFDFYILPNSDEYGKLLNLDYSTGTASFHDNAVWNSFNAANYPHELVHILFLNDKRYFKSDKTQIIVEGIPTWLAGPGFGETLDTSLRDIVSKAFQKRENITLEEIINKNFRLDFNNDILYTTGGVICKMVYEKCGKKGIWELLAADDSTFKSVVSKLMEMPFETFEQKVIAYIKNYAPEKETLKH